MNWEPLWHNAQWLVKWCNMWIAFGKVQPGDRRGWPLEVCFCKIIHPCFEEVQIEANNLIRRREILYSTVYTSVRSSSLKPVCGSLSQVGNYKYPITLSLGYRCRRQAGPPPIKGGWTGWLLAKRPIQSSPVRLRIKSTLETSPPPIWALSWRNSDFRFLYL